MIRTKEQQQQLENDNKKLITYDWVPYAFRLKIAAKINKSRPTIDNYINGKGKNPNVSKILLDILAKVPKPKNIKL